MMRMTWKWVSRAMVVALISITFACGTKNQESGATNQTQPPPSAAPPQTASADLSTPEGPIRAVFQAAQEKNYGLYRSAFSDAVPPELVSEQRFTRFAKRVNDGTVTLMPGSEKISETEAVVKMKNTKKNKERGYRVRKIGDRWLIVGPVGGGRRGSPADDQEEL